MAVLDAHAGQSISCSISSNGTKNAMKEGRDQLYWENGEDNGLVILAQAENNRRVRMTFVDRLSSEPKALLFAVAHGDEISEAQGEEVRRELKGRVSQIVIGLASNGTFTLNYEIYGQQLHIFCSEK